MKKKIAILGGGVGAMTAAAELTRPGVGDDYDVTVYQLGWRLGGKGASGRNGEACQRIEEHGVHVWSGLYENAFRLIREAYGELARPKDHPLATWRDAFKPSRDVSLMEKYGDEWVPWVFEAPTNSELPGEKNAHLFLPLWMYVGEGIQLALSWFHDSQRAKYAYHKESSSLPSKLLAAVVHGVLAVLVTVLKVVLTGVLRVTHLAYRVFKAVTPGPVHALFRGIGRLIMGMLIGVMWIVTRLQWRRVRSHMHHQRSREAWVFLNFAVGLLRGLHEDRLLEVGFDTIDHLDFREWLSQYLVHDVDPGAGPSAYDCDPSAGPRALTITSPLAMFLYDADFAFEDGDLCRPAFSAGAAVYTLIRLGLTWKGAVIWKMQAGMGDTIFAPFFEVLKRRGVRFEFFQKVKSLHLSEDGSRIESITIATQARVKAGRAEYQPLLPVKDLACWPSAPLWEQLEDGERLKTEGVDFEAWCGPEIDERTLRVGEDFDEVVLGISLGAHPYICQELIEANDRWKASVKHVGTVRTQAAQLWLRDTTEQMGWDHGGEPLLATFDASNFDTWADMSHLIDREDWPVAKDERPASIAYLCGPMREAHPPRGGRQSCEDMDQARFNDEIRSKTRAYLEDLAHVNWPNAAGRGHFDWDLLVECGSESGKGPARLAGQYARANVQPTERYVMSLPNTPQHRLHSGDSGFENLVLAGDWTWTAFNGGCVEGATISGMLAANKLCGSPALNTIVGLTFGYPNSPYSR